MGQAGLAVARGGGVGFGLFILDTGRLEPLRICERVETRVRIHAATIDGGGRRQSGVVGAGCGGPRSDGVEWRRCAGRGAPGMARHGGDHTTGAVV